MTVRIALLLFCFVVVRESMANAYRYTVDLKHVTNDQIRVTLTSPRLVGEQVRFYFPMTVPGTYATLDYGRFIDKLVAQDATGRALKVEKTGLNAFLIHQAHALATITYLVNDSWDAKVKENKIFEPAGTNFEEERNFVLNNGGIFGYFEGLEMLPYEITFAKPADLYGLTALPQVSYTPEQQSFRAESYHQLVDSPILFSKPDTTSFTLGDTRVSIGVYTETGTPAAHLMQQEIKASLEAIEKFLGKLPAEQYAFIIYLKDFTKLGKELQEAQRTGKMGLVKALRLAGQMKRQAFGALEHNTSSLYFLPDLGDSSYVQEFKEICIHEFMHILTPLNLHSELIGNFNYSNPQMSEHLWLYEGVTEYFTHVVPLKNGLITPQAFLKTMKDKYLTGQKFPATMSFAEMSKHVLQKPYKEQYSQVYDRGAVLGMLLDIEIMRLSKGEQTLKDVLLQLTQVYGVQRSFKEGDIVNQIVEAVHPDLKQFFDKYVYGKDSLDIATSLAVVGVEYVKSRKELLPKHFLGDNDVKYKRPFVSVNGIVTIQSVGENDFVGFKKGDKVQADQDMIDKVYKDEQGEYLKEGTRVTLPIEREGKKTELTFAVQYKEGLVKERMKVLQKQSPDQARLYQRWTRN